MFFLYINIFLARWEIKNGCNERILPIVHKSQVSSLAISEDGTLVSTGWDDSIAFTEFVLTKFGKFLELF